jgi:hypothetical protein
VASLRRLAVAVAVAAALGSGAVPARAARAPTFAEREAITAALPSFIRSVPVECLWLDIRVSSRDRRYAYVGLLFLNTLGRRSRCIRYASNGFFVLKKTRRWTQIFNGSEPPSCSLRIPADLTPCTKP